MALMKLCLGSVSIMERSNTGMALGVAENSVCWWHQEACDRWTRCIEMEGDYVENKLCLILM